MDLLLAEDLSKKLQISRDQVVREEYELFFLRDVFASTLGPSLVFKGGTALRLAYGSPRFSDDLDFSCLTEIEEGNFVRLVNQIGSRYPNVSVADARKKRYTLFALMRVAEEWLKLPFSIKIEVSARKVSWQAETDFVPMRLSSPVSNVLVVANTATLERMWQDKKNAVGTREKSRDLYDFWYISGRLGEKVVLPKHKISLVRLKADLNRVLPKNERYVVDYLYRSP